MTLPFKNNSGQSALEKILPEAAQIIRDQNQLLATTIPLVASMNFTSEAVNEAMSSYAVARQNYESNKPKNGNEKGDGFYEGTDNVQNIEALAIAEAKELFGCKHASVQPLSGSTAVSAAILGVVPKGGKILSMTMADGGHFTHGSPENVTGKNYSIISYGVDQSGIINYDDVKKFAQEHKPELVIVGGSSYPRTIDFKRLADIAHDAGAKLMVDASHYFGLMAAGVYPHAFPHADIVVGSTHKTLRGERGGLILWNDDSLKLHEAVFPGQQGEPHPANMLANAVALAEAATPDFKAYGQQVVSNAKALENTLRKHKLNMITDGTDTHLVLIDVRSLGINGTQAATALRRAGLIANKMPIPHDEDPLYSGVRLGTPAGTTLGMKEQDFEKVGQWVAAVLDGLGKRMEDPAKNNEVETSVRAQVKLMCQRLRFAEQIAQISGTPAAQAAR